MPEKGYIYKMFITMEARLIASAKAGESFIGELK